MTWKAIEIIVIIGSATLVLLIVLCVAETDSDVKDTVLVVGACYCVAGISFEYSDYYYVIS